jgi:hypothetical protein
VQRTQVWLAISPIIVAGVLAAHALAYQVTGTSPGATHDYLDHTPQLLVVLALLSFVFAGLTDRLKSPPSWPFPVVAVATFVVQEHVERVVHTGEIPWLLTSPVFGVGVLLQLPMALLIWALARRLLGVLAELVPRRPRVSHVLVRIVAPVTDGFVPVAVRPRTGRGPPPLRRR